MFEITLKDIREETYRTFFVRGEIYYEEGRVIKFSRNKVLFVVNAIVSGNKQYEINIQYRNNKIVDYKCTCLAYRNYDVPCKHIVAVILKMVDIKRKNAEYFLENTKYKKNILTYFDNIEVVSEHKNKQEVTLDMSIEFFDDYFMSNRINFGEITLRVGTDRLYIVKNIKEFSQRVMKGKPIVFGNRFTYNPSDCYFNETDTKIIRFIYNMASYESYFTGGNFSSESNSKIFKAKTCRLMDVSLEEFLDICGEKKFAFIFREVRKEGVVIRDGMLSCEYTITTAENNLSFKIKFPEDMICLTPNNKYIQVGNKILRLSDEQRKNLIPFIDILNDNDNRGIVVDMKYGEQLLSRIVPIAEKTGMVFIDEKVLERVEKHPLKAEIYLDKEKDKITLKSIFKYGKHNINAFASAGTGENSKIIIRDHIKEEKIMSLLEETGFKVSEGELYSNDENEFFYFMMEILDELSELAEIYYSETFKKIKIRKNMEFSISVKSDEDWLEIGFDFDDISLKEIREIMDAVRTRKKYYKLKNGDLINLSSNEMEQTIKFLESLDIEEDFRHGRKIKLPAYRAMHINSIFERQGGKRKITKDKVYEKLIKDIKKIKGQEYKVPSNLNNILRDYQKQGFKWLMSLSDIKFGGILADDMGIGKTVQALAFLLAKKEGGNKKPVLVVVPTSLVYNWQQEIDKFTPELKTLLIIGKKEGRREKIKNMENSDIVITTYHTLRRDIHLYDDIKFSYCFIDEAQHIKNPASQSARSVKNIRAESRFALTGTPVENNLVELWSIFDFVMPGYMYSLGKFKRKFNIGKEAEANDIEGLRRMIEPFILRRLKIDVLDELPEKIETKMLCDLSKEQKKIYIGYKESLKKELMKEISEKGFGNSQIKILAGLTRLRQICCHPAMFLENYKDGSGKLDLLMELIEDALESNHRVLLFSQFTSMLSIIQQELKEKDIEYFYLYGGTKAEDRVDYVNRFNGGERDLFLISLRAGGTGLNLTGADIVIHFDPWWNPAVEDQATDRAYRIGQKKSVQVIKLITKGSIEEKIVHLQDKKKQLIESIIKPGGKSLTALTEEQILDLFS